MDKMSLYGRLPIWGQNFACCFEGSRIKRTRYSKDFWRLLAEYESRNSWSYEQLCDYRDKKLVAMVHHCYNTVPYYAKLFNERGINPDSIKTLSDLKVLPILNKQIVNANPELFLSDAVPRSKMIKAHTSGTTGSGFVFYTTQDAICEQWAVWWRYRRKIGIDYGTLSANFGTKFVVPTTQKKPPYWRYNAPCHQVYFSAFHENKCNLDSYIDEIIKKQISWIHGYPSLITTLADYVAINHIDLKKQIKYVTIGAENLLEYQKKIINEAFGVMPYQHYGLSEGVANFSQQKDRTIIVDEDFSAVEFLPIGATEQVVGTNLTNYAMPLLRWNTYDTASVIEDAQKGRMVSSIDGRLEDYVILPDGTKIGKLDHVFKDTIHLREAQIHQNSDYSLDISVITDGSDVTADIENAKKVLYESFGIKIPVSFVIVETLPKSATGKLRFIVSDVKVE